MSVQKMSMVNIIGKYERLDDTIRKLLYIGCYHSEPTSDLMQSAEGFTSISEENPYLNMYNAIQEIFAVGNIEPEIIEADDKMISSEEVTKLIDNLDSNLKNIQSKRQELQRQRAHIAEDISHLERFVGINFKLSEIFACQFVKIRFGRIPIEGYQKISSYQNNPYVLFFPCSKDDSHYFGMYLAPYDEIDEVDRIFTSLFFERLRLPKSPGSPQESIDVFNEQIEDIDAQLKAQDDAVNNYFANNHDECVKLYSNVKAAYDAFELRKYATKYRNNFMIVGWVPVEKIDYFASEVQKVEEIEVTVEDVGDSKTFKPPTKLKNARIFKPFEFYVQMYGMPNYNEIDPTAFVAITYTILFGIMFADVGQGLVLAIVGFLMYKFKNMAIGKILVPCGISGAAFGLVFGSVFGFEHALDPMYNALGFNEKPIEVMNSANSLLAFSVIIGIVLIICAMLLNIYSSIKQKRLANALFGHNGVVGIVFFMSLLSLIGGPSLGLTVPTTPVVIFGCILPVLLIFSKEILGNIMARKKHPLPESIGEYVIENIFELFEVILSYGTNTLSFLRVGAFVLVHAVMMMIFFMLAELFGGVGYVIMIIFGNIFVILLEGLIVNIQVLRLEFYEMFSRFYIGEGREFEPIEIKAE